MPPTEANQANPDNAASGDGDARGKAIAALIESGALEEAERICRERIAAGEVDATLFSQMAGLCGRRGRWQELRQWVERALELEPDQASAHSHLGVALRQAGDRDGAIASFRRALALAPADAYARSNLGTALQEQGDLEGAQACYRQAIAERPSFAEAHTNLGMLLLLQGHYPEGWQEYEWRHAIPRATWGLLARPRSPRWDGTTPLAAGEELLLVAEQGLGDTLQFARYLLPLRRAGLAVRLCAQPQLHGLLRSSGLDPDPLSPTQAAEDWNGPWLPLLSLPGVLGVTPETPIHSEPHLQPDPARIERWRARLAHAPRPLVAIAWQGNPEAEQTTLRGRSLPLESFSPLAQRTDITFLSLQKGFGAEQLASCSFRHRFLDIQGEIDQAWDFLDAAAILACCDLVLSSDTALAHLSAGMGAPTWLLLQNLPEWRWGLQGDSSPWYPSLQIFRQSTPGDWTSLLHHVADDFLHLQQLQALLAPPEPQAPLGQQAPLGLEAAPGLDAAPALKPAASADFPTGISADAEAERLFQLGNAREEQGDSAGAIAAWRRALELRPEYPEALNNLALTLHEQGDPRAAIATFEEALRRRPAFVAARFNLGNALQDVGALDEAIACFQQTLALQGDLAEAHLNLGSALQERGDRAAARTSFEAALRLRPHDADAHGNLALLDLLEGDYDRGWPGSEWRFRGPAGLALLIARPAGPRWGGEALPAGTSLLLVAEQGLGDTLQFVRYLPLLRQRGMAVRLCAPPALHRLLEASGLENEPLTPAEGQNWSEPWLPLLSLPGLLGVSQERPLVQAPYLRVPEELVASWRRRLADKRRPLLALHWQGNPEHERRHARGRSLPLDTFAPLARSGEATFLSLQKGFGAEQLAACPFRDRFVAAQEEIDQTWDFLETAAILSACDRLICADSGVAHLAGGLGHPTWLLLKDIPDWRWGLEGESSFWYPSGLRLFRQRRRGDWGEVVERVAAALEGT